MHNLTEAQLEHHARRCAAVEKANANPLPGPLLDAVLPEPILAAGLTLRAVVASDLALLRRLNSPLIAELEQLSMPEAERQQPKYTEEDCWELLYLWTRPVAEARAALNRGREHYRETALRTIADPLPASVLAEAVAIMQAIAENFLRGFETAIQYQARPSADGTIFTQPPAERPTASVGGSN